MSKIKKVMIALGTWFYVWIILFVFTNFLVYFLYIESKQISGAIICGFLTIWLYFGMVVWHNVIDMIKKGDNGGNK